MPQHVIQRGNNRSTLFVTDSDYRFFHGILREACELHGCQVHAYVLMRNHVHLLMTPSTASGISTVMQTVGRRYVRCFNDAHGRTGTLWEGRFKATLVDTERYLLACHRYIELNPVRAGLVPHPQDYRWSSHRANALGASDTLVTPHEHYETLGRDTLGRLSAYRALFGDVLPDATLDEIRSATNSGWALGSKKFRDEVSTLLARRAQPALKGRPPRRNDPIRL